VAIYHLNATVVSRGRGQSIVAAAAYRAGITMRDERYGTLHNYTGRHGPAEHSEIMAPAAAPPWVADRETLWNRVEAAELRKDSQLARLIEVGLPVELQPQECIALLRDYIAKEFVAKGMIADFSIRRDNSGNPQAHILLSLREIGASGFGPKQRRWNGKSNLLEWRAAWAACANEHLARAGHAVRIDHRTLEAQQIELAPGRRVGFGGAREAAANLPSHLLDRLDEQRRIAHENGEAILEDPAVVLRAITHQRPWFGLDDLALFLRSRTDETQFEAAYRVVTESAELVALPSDGTGRERFTSRDMLDAAKSLTQRVRSMTGRRGHGVRPSVVPANAFDEERQQVFDYLIGEGDAKAIAITDDSSKAALLTAARQVWEAGGFHVTGVSAQTLADLEREWQQDRSVLTKNDVLLIDGAETIALKQLERVVGIADKVRAKVVFIGDESRLKAMRVESPFRSVLLEIGPVIPSRT
jgi:Ti-type conjugative transfer relaxase TraA